jgi:hypothetical protein
MRPGFPAFADRLGVALDVDLLHAIDIFFHGLSGIFTLLLKRFEDRPEER